MSLDVVTFTVPGKAAPQGSKTKNAYGSLYESSKRVNPWRSDVRQAAMIALKDAGVKGRQEYNGRWTYSDPWEGPLALEVAFDFRRPASHLLTDGISLSSMGRRAPYPGRRGDGDKLLRAVADALTGIVYCDDDQIVYWCATKAWGPRDEARVAVRRLRGAAWAQAA